MRMLSIDTWSASARLYRWTFLANPQPYAENDLTQRSIPYPFERSLGHRRVEEGTVGSVGANPSGPRGWSKKREPGSCPRPRRLVRIPRADRPHINCSD